MSYTLQILHASDFEAGLAAIDRAGNFAAIVDYLEDTQTNSITLSSGDNYLPSPFFNAGGDPSLAETLETALEDFYNLADGTLNLAPSIGRADIAILNILGIQASAIGNHEYDAGTREIQNLIARTNSIINPNVAGWIGTQFPYLSANTDFSGDANLNPFFTSAIQDASLYNLDPLAVFTDGNGAAGTLASSRDKIAPATIIEENGERIGIVGATTQIVQSISSTGGIEIIGDNINDMQQLADILQPTIDALIAQGINKIIVTSHLQQLAFEQALAPLLTGVDIIIGGGSNTRLADNQDTLQPGDVAQGDYPIISADSEGNPLLIVNTDGEYSYVGRLVVTFDDAGNVVTNSVDPNVSGAFAANSTTVNALYANPLDIDGDGSTDAAFEQGSRGDLVNDITAQLDAVITAQDGNIFGSSDVYIEGRREFVRTQETNLGNLSADANLFYAQQVDATVTVSIKNGGGIRDSIGRIEAVGDDVNLLPPGANPDAGKLDGQVSQLDIANSLRFNNALSLITVTAAQLLQVLEHAVAATTATSQPGQFAQIGGIAFSFDRTQPAGNRVQSASLIDDDGNAILGLVRDGELAVDPSLAIRVVTLSFLLTGGDSYPFQSFIAANPSFANVVNLSPELVPDGGVATFAAEGTEQDALAEYLAANFTDTPFNDAETSRAGDTRIQNLEFRRDTVLDGGPINGDGNPNILAGTNLNETINAGGGNDVVNAGAGNDRVNGAAGNDALFGGAGNDILNGGPGIDRLSGGAGIDYVQYTDPAGVSISLATNVRNTGEAAGDILNSIEGVLGTSGADRIGGNGYVNYLYGYAGDDVIAGNQGNDTLFGGTGADTFVFNTALDAATNVDRILDFNVVDDTIQIDRTFFLSTLQLGTLSDALFTIGTAAADASDRFIYDPTTGALSIDRDGTGALAQIQFATLSAGLNAGPNPISAADFFIVA